MYLIVESDSFGKDSYFMERKQEIKQVFYEIPG
jgi:hypothetical protein